MQTVLSPAQLFGILEQHIPNIAFGSAPTTLYEPIDYFMKMGGKRMRPLLTLLACQLYRPAQNPQVLQAAMALEVFHNFTLLHDDIMDQAPLRRGFETVHIRYDTNVAILAGDVMMSHSFEMLAGSLPEAALRTGTLAFCKMARQVCEGQQLDMDFQTQSAQISLADYIRMITLKTAVLPAFALELGAIMADASSQSKQLLYDFGLQIGLGFQIMDDWLDVFGDPAKTGKQTGGDILAGKKTFLLIEAMQAASPIEQKLIIQTMQDIALPAEQKIQIIKQIYLDTKADALTLKAASAYYQAAFETLDKLKSEEVEPQAWQLLEQFARQSLVREN